MKSNKSISGMLFLFVLVIHIISCSGGGNGGSSNGLPTESASGIWEGTFHSNILSQDYNSLGIIIENNETRFITDWKAQYVGSIVVNGNNVSGTLIGFAPLGFQFLDGSTVGTLTINGTVATKQFITGTYEGLGDSGTFTLTYNPIYETPSSLSKVSDSWIYSEADYALSMTIDSNGIISGNDADGCEYNGNINIINV